MWRMEQLLRRVESGAAAQANGDWSSCSGGWREESEAAAEASGEWGSCSG